MVVQGSKTLHQQNPLVHNRRCQLTQAHTHPFNGPVSGTTRVSRYQKGKTNLDFTEARDSECQWHPLGHMQVCTSLRPITMPVPHRSVFYWPLFRLTCIMDVKWWLVVCNRQRKNRTSQTAKSAR